MSGIDFLLTTLNARYHHSSLALRYLYANLGKFQERSLLVEGTINEFPEDIALRLLSYRPRLIAFSVYIWNVEETKKVIEIIKKVSSETLVVLGGPEVSYEVEGQEIVELADYVITGEGEISFYQLLDSLFESSQRPEKKIIRGESPRLDSIQLPYDYYTKEDIEQRYIYVEVSRGCAYRCEFCLSSLDEKVRYVNLDSFFSSMENLLDKGVRNLKFLDRTFNLRIDVCKRILEFFIDRIDLGLFLHFEVVPDRLPEELKGLIQKFPVGSLQFEIGIQTMNSGISERINRRQNYTKIKENIQFLANETGVHLHTDLIVGLPGESVASFARGFDELVSWAPHEIQVGILKRLNGAPIVRHSEDYGLVFSRRAPYSLLKSRDFTFFQMMEFRAFSKFWDLLVNSGNFRGTFEWLRGHSLGEGRSYFELIMGMTRFLMQKHPHYLKGVNRLKLADSLFCYLVLDVGFLEEHIKKLILEDLQRTGVKGIPAFLKGQREGTLFSLRDSASATSHRMRQLRHQ